MGIPVPDGDGDEIEFFSPVGPSHSSSAGPSRKRSRSPTTSVPVSSHVPRSLSSVRVDLLPPHKRIRSLDSATNLKDYSEGSSESSVPRETSLRDDIVVRDKEVETSARGIVEVRVSRVTHPVVSDDIPEPAQEEGVVKVTYETLRGMGSGAQDYSYGSAECCLVREDQTIPNTRSGATITRGAVDNLIGRRGGENGDDYEGENGGGHGNGNGNRGVNGNRNGGGNGNGNGNGDGNGNEGGNGYENHNVNFEGFRLVARESTYQEFLKCQPLNFKGTEGVVGLTR
ncbi:hypothetical protein Tco_0965608 [Tanacetum coccineum]